MNFWKNNKLNWYLLILLSLFILVLFTKNQVSLMYLNLEEKSIKQSELEVKREELNKLDAIRSKAEDKNSWLDKYSKKLKEEELMYYIYSKIDSDNLKYSDWISTIRSLNISEWKINELWFYESTVTLSVRVPNETAMFRLLDFFIDDKTEYKFFVDSFNYPKNENWLDSSFNVTVPLKVFYK